MTRHEILGGKVKLYKRGKGKHWQCSTYLEDRKHRVSTGEEGLEQAKSFADNWYFELRFKQRAGELRRGKTFSEAAEQFMREYLAITAGKRNAVYVKGHRRRLDNHLLPFFGPMLLHTITAGVVQEYRIRRHEAPKEDELLEVAITGFEAAEAKSGKPWKPPATSTLHQEIVVLRQVLKAAQRLGWITALPDLSPPFRGSGKITHRAWFSPKEYRQLYLATRRRAETPPKERWRHSCEQLHDYVLFMANTGLRPDEALRLEYRDVTIVKDHATGQTILEIEVRGKRGVGHCKSMTGAVGPFIRLKKRNKPNLTDRIFPTSHPDLLNIILKEEGLKFDREGNRRTAYSLRHTYICLRLMEGADIYQIAKNCRTSVEMIEKYYATHIKTTLDTELINVRRERPGRKKNKNEQREN